MEFRVNNAAGILVTQLGAFDHQGNGIAGTQNGGIRVAVFNKITRTIVAGLDVNISGNADEYTGNHRMKNVNPVVLPPGNYMIVAKGYNQNELNGNVGYGTPRGGVDSAGGAVTFTGTSAYGPVNSGFAYPANNDGGPVNRYLAGTFSCAIPVQRRQTMLTAP